MSISDPLADESKLSWQDYQQIVLDAVRSGNERTFSSGEVWLSNDEFNGVADIEVRYTSPSIVVGPKIVLQKSKVIAAIECKRRRRTLELDVVGKIFCYAIVNKPDSLFIISPKPLAAQARFYAEKLFGSPTSSAPFDHTHVYNMSLRQLLSRDGGSYATTANATTVESVTVWREHTWGVEVVADSAFVPNQIEVPAGSRIILEFTLSGVVEKELFLAVADPAGKALTPYNRIAIEAGAKVRLGIPSGLNTSVAGLLAKAAKGGRCVMPVEPLHFVSAGCNEPFGDLREDEARNFARTLNGAGAPRVIAVHGEGGVGKSYFCESAARLLKEEHSYDCFQAIATETEGCSLFARILRARLFSNIHSRGDHQSAVEFELAQAIFQALDGGIAGGEGDVTGALQRAMDGRETAPDGLTVLDGLARAVKHCPTPLLVVIRNCHLLPATTIRMMRELFLRLHAEGWGSTHFLLEYRDTDRRENLVWEEALIQFATELAKTFDYHSVNPLTHPEIERRVCCHIECPEAAAVASALVRMTGGNPMFLEHLVRQLIDEAIIVDGINRRYRVDHIELFRRRIEALPRTLENFLYFRIGEVVAKAEARLRPIIKGYL